MKQFIAIIKSTGGVLEKFQSFDTQDEADAHVVEFGGWVAPNPGGNNRNYWVIDAVAKTIGYDQGTQDGDLAMKSWETAISLTDLHLPRAVEDLWDVHGSPNDRTQKLLDDKKALRAARP